MITSGATVARHQTQKFLSNRRALQH